jgi:hypothetical protein
LRRHEALWWDGIEEERKKKNKAMIKSWNRMITKLKGKFLPRDFQLSLFRKMQNLKQRLMTVREYTEEFYKVNIRASHIEDTPERVARYINGLRFEIQDELSLLSPKSVEDAYQFTLKAEEKLARKQNQKNRGRSPARGKGKPSSKGRFQFSREEEGSSSNQPSREGESRGRRSFSRGQGKGSDYQIKCYRCGKLGHMSWDCPENNPANQRGAHVAEAKEENVDAVTKEEAPEVGESLLMKRVLVKSEKEAKEPAQRKSLFRTVCKSKGKCCKVVIDSGSTDNLVSIEMVEKLGLKRIAHPTPYKVSWLQKGHQILVNEQCNLEIQIGSYKDEVLCDIMPMDVCHIFLGRPWRHDRKAIHDGRKNIYSLEKNGQRHVLLPLKDEGVKEEAGPSVLLISGKELLQEVKKEVHFALIGKPKVILTSTNWMICQQKLKPC